MSEPGDTEEEEWFIVNDLDDLDDDEDEDDEDDDEEA